MITGHVTILTAVVLSFASAVQAQVAVAERSITELQELMTSGETTALSITQAYLDRIQAYDQQGPIINAMVWLKTPTRVSMRKR